VYLHVIFDSESSKWFALSASFSGILNPEERWIPRLANASRTKQIAFALRQAANGATVDEVCRKIGVFEPTFDRWKKRFVGRGVPEIRWL
jgi:hypothetical protein